MSKNIVDGKLVALSPSMVNAFDASTSFGCERRGWFRYVKGLPEAQQGNQALGTALHALVERRLLEGKTPEVPGRDHTPECDADCDRDHDREGEAAGLYLAGESMIEEVAKRVILGVERPLKTFEIADVPVKGFIDVVTEDGIIDWKTTSDIRRYGKTAEQLATDTQMVIYAQAMHPTRDSVLLAHGQFQTRGRKWAQLVEVEVTRKHLDEHTSTVIVPLVERIKEVATFTEYKQATPNYKPCFNCSFKQYCPKEGMESIMAFFKTKAPSSVAHIETVKDMIQNITPPDAPASDPAFAADPIEGFPPMQSGGVPLAADVMEEPLTIKLPEAWKPKNIKDPDATPPSPRARPTPPVDVLNFIAPAKVTTPDAPAAKKRGRPPGAKNKPVEAPEVLPIPRSSQNVTQIVDYAPLPAPSRVVVKSVTFSKGVTVNLGNFSSVRFDVSMTAEGDGAFEAVRASVEAKLDAEIESYEAEVAKGQKVPASELLK